MPSRVKQNIVKTKNDHLCTVITRLEMIKTECKAKKQSGLICAHHLHGASLVVTNEGRPPLDGDWLRQWHSPVCLVTGEVLQAAGIRLLLPVLPGGRRSERDGKK